MSCNICQPDILMKIVNGELTADSLPEKTEKCSICNSPPRLKTFQIAYHQYVRPWVKKPKEELSALLISGVKYEQLIVAGDFGTLLSASLYGEYGPNTIRSDIRNLKEFETEKLDLVSACNVLDYVYEIEAAFQSVFRVLRPGGFFLFHIAEFRLLGNNEPPTIAGSKKEPYYPEGVTVPSVTFGKEYLCGKLREIGFEASRYEITDLFSDQVCTWFLGKKL